MSDPPRITAIVVDHPGDEDAMRVGTVPRPRLGPTELRLAVRAAGVNRADLLQRQGKYPPPPGSSEVLGLECAGEVVEVGREVRGWKTGDRAMALLAGGGYAAEAVAPAGCALPVPEALSWEEAAALPEVFLTAFLTIFEMARFAPGEVALVHGGGSGVGTAAITLVTRSGGRIAVTAGSEEKCGRCRAHGAGLAVNYREQDFAAEVRSFTGGRGADVVLDHIGAPYLARNLDALAANGRLVLIATMGGGTAEIDLRTLMRKRLAVMGSTLRGRPVEEKAALVEAFLHRFGADLVAGRVRPVVDRVYPLAQAPEAHRRMATSLHFGKLVLRLP